MDYSLCPTNLAIAVVQSNRWSEWLWQPLRLNWPLVLVGIGAIWAALRTLDLIKRQADIMAGQTKDTATAAKAASHNAIATLKSVEAFKNAERAWVDVYLTKIGPAVYNLEVKNCGRTVAKIKEFCLIPKLSPSPETLPEASKIYDFENSTTVRRSKLLVPDDPWVILTINLVTNLGKEDFASVWANKIGLVYYGILRYDDISDEAHETYFCYLF